MSSSSLATSAATTRDCLTALPSELLHIIIGYLFPSHIPDLADDTIKQPPSKTGGHSHDLDYLAATSKILRDEVNDWARSWLVQHQDITKFKDGKIWPKATVKRNGVIQRKKGFNTNYLRGRNGALLHFIDRNCVFCGKKSKKKAILMNGLMCCMVCDKKEWPNKVTKSEACEKFALHKDQLLAGKFPHTTAAQKLAEHYPGLRPPRYGTYWSCNCMTTIFNTKDVERFAKAIHGNLQAHLAKREEQRKKYRESKKRGEQERAAKAAAAASAEAEMENARIQLKAVAQIGAGTLTTRVSADGRNIERAPEIIVLDA